MSFITSLVEELDSHNLLFPTIFLCLLPFLYVLILKPFKSQYLFKSPPLPPGPFQWPILGNILQIGKKPHIDLTRLAQTYGPLISLKLGTQLVIMGSSPTVAIEFLKTHDRNLSARYVPHVSHAKAPELNNLSLAWVLECHDSWKNLRNVTRTGLFSSKALQSQTFIREKKIKEMVGFIGNMQGKLVKIREVTFAVVFNMLSNVLVSKDLINFENECVNGEISDVIRRMMDAGSAPNISDFYPILAPFDLQKLRKKSLVLFRKSYDLWETIVKQRKQSMIGDNIASTTHQDFLDVLINNGSSIDQISIILLELLVAGTDTSTATVEWTLAELIKNPKCMRIVQEELSKEINHLEGPKESDLPKLKYLEACVKETLRLHPPAPLLLPHRAAETCQVMNYTIPKNTQIIVNYGAIARDPNLWEDPLDYKPERFFSINSSLDFKGNDYEFIPFGSGRRLCPGMPMAAKQVPLILASLIHYFDWSLPHGKNPKDLDMSEQFGIVITMEDPLIMIPQAKILL